MENILENSDAFEISKKSRCLDLQGLYIEKSRISVSKGGVNGGFEVGTISKRKGRSSTEIEESGLGQVKKKRKGRKEVSLSSFDAINKKRGKGLNAVGVSGLNLESSDLNNLALKSSRLDLYQEKQSRKKNGQVLGDRNVQNSSTSSSISHSLDDIVPKRPRDLLRRKKYQSNHKSEHTETSSSKVCSDAEIIKLRGDSVAPIDLSEDKEKNFDDFKENSSSRANLDQHLQAEDGASIRYNSENQKRQESSSQKRKLADEAEVWVNDFAKVGEDLQEDDEENLEQNAARMLSSRFDPSCTMFSGNNKASSTSPYMNPLSLVSSLQLDFATPGTKHSAGLESTSADGASRVLRPRKQHKEKGLVRRRRHFYEIVSTDLDAYWVLNRRIQVFWPLDQSWYFGIVIDYDPERKLHHVKYDDRDEEWIDLQNERFKLLLLPSEVPGKSGSEKSGLGGKSVELKNKDISEEDHHCIGSYMDSEPIISWLARSTHQVKSSSLGIAKKQKTLCQSKTLVQPILSGDSVGSSRGCLGVDPSRKEAHKLYCNSVLPDRPAHGEVTEKSTMARITSLKDRRLPYVYFRRRFRKRGQGFGCISEESSGCRSLAGSVKFLASVVDRVGDLEEYDVHTQGFGMKDTMNLDKDWMLQSSENFELSKLIVPPMKLKEVKLNFSFPLRLIYIHTFDADIFWLFHTLLLLQYGTVVAVWPKVQLEMLFVDNVVGLKFMLFEGCLMQAVACVCLVLTAFHQPNEHGVDLQLPATSIRFKLSGFCDLGRQFVFVVYNFLEVKNSKWLYLDGKLKQYCLVIKTLPLVECTYNNIKALQSGSDHLPVPCDPQDPVLHEGLCKRSSVDIMHMGMPKESAYIDMNCSSSKFVERHGKLPPFVLSFAAAPTFFLSLHLKLLMENNVASMSLQNRDSVSLLVSENYGRSMGDDCPSVEKFSNEVHESALENNSRSGLRDAADSGWLSCAKLKVETDVVSVKNDGDWMKSSQKYLNGELDVTGTSVGPQGSGNETNDIDRLRRHPYQRSVSERYAGRSWPSVSEERSSSDKSETGCISPLNGISVQIPPLSQVEAQSFDRGARNNEQSTSDLAWNRSDLTIRSPNPTAPRSVWHRNRHHSLSSSSLGYRSKRWPDGGSDLIRNAFGNGSRKPHTQVSYKLPFGGYDFGSKPRSHHRKGRPYKRIRNDNEKISGGSRSQQRHPELLHCDANVLITVGDRGWRECGAQVVLEFVDHRDWRILVKLSGLTKYSFKAHQFLQPGTTNRYTHAMMWKGEKDWILEFPDRSQWPLFRELYEECYNRNIRAAFVKNIPIPGVRRIDENGDNAMEEPFVRSSPKYFQQVETEVEMALNPSRVLYDMESDDEDWVSKYQTSSDINGSTRPEISEEIFERTIDMFEKVAYGLQRDSFTSDEIEDLIVGVGPIDVVKAIHEHWLQKRQRKGMPLIRQFQPPLWQRYQQQVKEWELAMYKTNNFPNECKEKAAMIEKPPMFAFCLRPRGLEVPNKVPKQRSQRKPTTGGHSNAFLRDQNGLQVSGRKLNGSAFGEERVVTGPNHETLDSSPWLQKSTRVLSPRDAVNTGYLSMSSDGSENQHSKVDRNRSKKIGAFLFRSDTQMMATSYNHRMTGKRNGSCRWNMGLPEWPNQKQFQPEGSQRQRFEKLGGSDLDEFRLRDASGAAQHASNMAKLKREKAQRLLYRADVAIHKAVVALMTAEAIKASSEKDSTDDG